MKINFLFSFLGDLSLIIAHELWRQECTLLMAQQQILGMIKIAVEQWLTLDWYKRLSCDCWVKSGLQREEIFLSLTGHNEWAGHKGNNSVAPMWLSEREDKPPCDPAVSFWESISTEKSHLLWSCQRLFRITGFHRDESCRQFPKVVME